MEMNTFFPATTELHEGIGVDLIEVPRVQRVVERWGEEFLHRIYNVAELAYCLARAVPWMHLAARLAAKEAAYKALGCAGMSWHDVWVETCENGAPILRYHPKIEQLRPSLTTFLSLSHTREHAVAMVLARWQNPVRSEK